MSQSEGSQGFDNWASSYDQFVINYAKFPFEGYQQVLDKIAAFAEPQPNMHILDLGIGTGNLTERFQNSKVSLWGLDFSQKMLDQAQLKLPQAHLAQADVFAEWPADFQRRFDRIVSAYLFHEFDLAAKVRLLNKLMKNHLVEGGQIVIGDIAFEAVQARELAHHLWIGQWDEDEYYWAADEAIAACEQNGLSVAYTQVSSCAGVFVVRPTH